MMSFVPWTPRPRSDDATLARRVAGGDCDALASVYSREAGAVYRYALALCGNAAWAAVNEAPRPHPSPLPGEKGLCRAAFPDFFHTHADTAACKVS